MPAPGGCVLGPSTWLARGTRRPAVRASGSARQRRRRLFGQAIAAIITAAAAAAGLDKPPADPLDDAGLRRYTGHSTRRGFVTTALARKDADAAAIAEHGRWTRGSNAFWNYYEPDRDWDKHPGDGLL
ncbi:hypothetical protein ACFQ9X_25775 [Catenulispora yoronensis]